VFVLFALLGNPPTTMDHEGQLSPAAAGAAKTISVVQGGRPRSAVGAGSSRNISPARPLHRNMPFTDEYQKGARPLFELQEGLALHIPTTAPALGKERRGGVGLP